MKCKTKFEILVVEEKHGTRYFVAEPEEALFRAALMLVKARLRDGWYEDVDKVNAQLAISAQNGAAARDLLLRRQDAEYEDVYTAGVEEVLP